MPNPNTNYVCLKCCIRINPTKLASRRLYHNSPRLQIERSRPSIAPKLSIDIKSIRQNPSLYEKNCIERRYKAQSTNPARINALFEEWRAQQREGRSLRERSNILRRLLADPQSVQVEDLEGLPNLKTSTRDEILAEARVLKDQLSEIESKEESLTSEIEALAAEIPNLTSDETPLGDIPKLVGVINKRNLATSAKAWRSHVEIGSELSLLDFSGAATSTGWGWYYLINEAALLEQALIQYALSAAMARGWTIVSPPSIVYSHIASACGFQPRDQNGEQQIYNLAQPANDAVRGKPELSLAATAEIPLAAMKAGLTMEGTELPLKCIAVSRCYRAEAGARGVDTKGLYRVHEFSKVEMFAWTAPSNMAATAAFEEILSIQTDILESLNLHCRILEMSSTDLGASATRKRDIEAFFPSRQAAKSEGWGEVTSASMCSDYQTRRLATRVRTGGKLDFPYTVNGTAVAVPRVLAAIMENGWDEERMVIKIPEVLRPWMGGLEVIAAKRQIT